jgi:uncharacterized protein (DUF58 family)
VSGSGKIGTILTIAIMLLIFGVVIRDGRVLSITIPFFLYAGVALLSAGKARAPDIILSRKLSTARTTEGETVEVVVTLENTGPPIPWIGVVDHIPSELLIKQGTTRHFAKLDAGEKTTFFYTLRVPRGLHTLAGADITTWQKTTLVPKHEFLTSSTDILAIPIAEPIGDIEIRPERTRAYAGLVRASMGGSGIDFFGCHAYSSGDDIRRINWRAYARTRKLIVNEYEQERIADITIFLDARERANPTVGEKTTFTYSVRAAASMSSYFIKKGNNVGLFIYGEYMNWTFPGYGKNQLRRILDSLALAQTANKDVFDDLQAVPTRLFPPRSQLVMISGSLDEHDVEIIGVLRARGYRIIMIIPDMLGCEAQQIPTTQESTLALRIVNLRRRLIVDALARIGVEVVQWNTAYSLASVTSWILSRQGRRLA